MNLKITKCKFRRKHKFFNGVSEAEDGILLDIDDNVSIIDAKTLQQIDMIKIENYYSLYSEGLLTFDNL